MIDLGIGKMALIGVVALVVIGPKKLPGVARTVGALLGKAQRYVADVKAEVNRSIDLEELKKMREGVETAARDVESSIQTAATDFNNDMNTAMGGGTSGDEAITNSWEPLPPSYKNPNKKWRVKRSAMPNWYKAQSGTRTKALSGAARVARFRPKALN
jgi:sec-independent protein translocase protein TatB